MVITKNTTQVHAGFLHVFIDGVTAGYSEGGATIAVEQEVSEVNVDDFGSSPVDVTVQGTGATVTLRLAQVTNPEVLALLIPGTTITTSGNITRLQQGANTGNSLLSSAHELVLSGTKGSIYQQWRFHKAVAQEGFELEYNREDQTIAEVPFRVLPDPNKQGSTDQLYRYEQGPK
jgi:hypothetical protein